VTHARCATYQKGSQCDIRPLIMRTLLLQFMMEEAHRRVLNIAQKKIRVNASYLFSLRLASHFTSLSLSAE